MSAEGMALSRQTRWWLAGLAVLVVAVLGVDAWRARYAPRPAAGEMATEGEARPGAAARADTRRGLNETPLLYSGEFARDVAARLAPGLVWAEPATGAPSTGLMVSPDHALVALWSEAPTWMLTTGTGQRTRARLAAVDRVHGVALLRLDAATLPALVTRSALTLQPAEALIIVRPMPGPPGLRTFQWPGDPSGMRELLGTSTHLRVVVGLDGAVVGLQLPASADNRWLDAVEMQQIAATLERDGRHPHPWSGLHVQEIDRALQARYGPAALVVTHVEPDSPAARAGVKEGVTLSTLERGDAHVTTEAGVRRLLAAPGPIAMLAMNGERYRFDVIDSALVSVEAAPATPRPTTRRAGASPASKRGLTMPAPGVTVRIEAGSPAATAGLRSDDAVVAIDGAAIASAATLDRALAQGRAVLVKVRRDGGYRYIWLPAAPDVPSVGTAGARTRTRR